MDEGTKIVATLDTPDGEGWSTIDTMTNPIRRQAVVRLVIHSDGSLAALVQTQELYPPPPGSAAYATGFVKTLGYGWRTLIDGRPPFLHLPVEPPAG